jgi:hypothetical protein
VRDGSKKTGGFFGSPEARAPKRMLRKGVEPLTLSLLDSCATNCANRARGRDQTKTGKTRARTHRPPPPSSPVLPSLDECGGQLTVAGESCTVSSWRCRAAGHRLGSGQSTPSVVPHCSRSRGRPPVRWRMINSAQWLPGLACAPRDGLPGHLSLDPCHCSSSDGVPLLPDSIVLSAL